MSLFTLGDAARALSAPLHGPDAAVAGVFTDTRKLAPGELFVALRGANFDGHSFVADAVKGGAAGVLVDEAACAEHGAAWQGLPLVVVKDTRLALGELAAWWRGRFILPVVAVTGSNGKTTVKEMAAAIFRAAAGDAAAVLATSGNLNNDIGMPLTLLKLRAHHRYAVIEMGMNHPGEIAYLVKLARPDAAAVNNAMAAHLEGLGSVEAVARAKGEIFSGLPEGGIAVINADDPHAALWRELAASHPVLTFGLGAGADVTAECHLDPLSSRLTLRTPAGQAEATLGVPGLHNVRNALAATALAQAVGVGPEVAAAGLSAFSGVPGRLQRYMALHGAALLDDTYNANPGSVSAAITVLAAMPGTRILVLGDMGELGEGGPELHREIGAAARQAGLDAVLTLGELAERTARAFGEGGQHFEYIEDLLGELENRLAPGVTVLVKGSRFMKMERVVKSFAA